MSWTVCFSATCRKQSSRRCSSALAPSSTDCRSGSGTNSSVELASSKLTTLTVVHNVSSHRFTSSLSASIYVYGRFLMVLLLLGRTIPVVCWWYRVCFWINSATFLLLVREIFRLWLINHLSYCALVFICLRWFLLMI